ncbi:hypothetical protein JOC77_003745 [Peribacillus deserti]|uniref:NUDIX hydrolase n=1 Tax=Peribacillus deserti TaxID=673318 RepID=A0ABS2QM80_9BACI|nr:hypothetical protein [Peribacillus deserti]MBM7694284.1 hypothetical protein [Peribacillus deserti]
MGVDILIKCYICCLENIYRIGNEIGHEITQIYLVEFKDKELYNKDLFTVTEGDRITCAKWINKKEILNGNKVLYPDGLTDLLSEKM